MTQDQLLSGVCAGTPKTGQPRETVGSHALLTCAFPPDVSWHVENSDESIYLISWSLIHDASPELTGKTAVDIGPFLTSKIIIQDSFGFSRKPPYKSRFFGSYGNWWCPWDGTLNRQPHIHLT